MTSVAVQVLEQWLTEDFAGVLQFCYGLSQLQCGLASHAVCEVQDGTLSANEQLTAAGINDGERVVLALLESGPASPADTGHSPTAHGEHPETLLGPEVTPDVAALHGADTTHGDVAACRQSQQPLPEVRSNLVPTLCTLEGPVERRTWAVHPLAPHTLGDLLRQSDAVESQLLRDDGGRLLMYQLLSGLAELHSAARWHGRLTPEHLPLTRDGWLWISGGQAVSAPHTEPRKGLPSLTRAWQRGELSNFDYLMELNLLAGRRLGDLTRYPLLPWVLDMTESPEAGMSSTQADDRSRMAGWRDLSRSKWRLAKGDEQLDATFANSAHHVSDDALSELAACIYKARRLPKALLTKAVRTVFIAGEYPATLRRLYEWSPDEAIPEFYTDASVFDSLHEDMPSLKVPEWAADARNFVQQHRAALESDRVSASLHHWINLTFGYQLAGDAAVAATNVPMAPAADQVLHPGCSRVQLFDAPHPQRSQGPDESSAVEPALGDAVLLRQPEHICAEEPSFSPWQACIAADLAAIGRIAIQICLRQRLYADSDDTAFWLKQAGRLPQCWQDFVRCCFRQPAAINGAAGLLADGFFPLSVRAAYFFLSSLQPQSRAGGWQSRALLGSLLDRVHANELSAISKRPEALPLVLPAITAVISEVITDIATDSDTAAIVLEVLQALAYALPRRLLESTVLPLVASALQCGSVPMQLACLELALLSRLQVAASLAAFLRSALPAILSILVCDDLLGDDNGTALSAAPQAGEVLCNAARSLPVPVILDHVVWPLLLSLARGPDAALALVGIGRTLGGALAAKHLLPPLLAVLASSGTVRQSWSGEQREALASAMLGALTAVEGLLPVLAPDVILSQLMGPSVSPRGNGEQSAPTVPVQLLLAPDVHRLASPQMLNRVAGLLVQATKVAGGKKAFCQELLPQLLPLLTCPAMLRSSYGAAQAADRASNEPGTPTAHQAQSEAERRAKLQQHLSDALSTAIVPCQPMVVRLTGNTASDTGEDAPEDAAYWDLVYILYPEAVNLAGPSAVHDLVPNWELLERMLASKFGWKLNGRAEAPSSQVGKDEWVRKHSGNLDRHSELLIAGVGWSSPARHAPRRPPAGGIIAPVADELADSNSAGWPVASQQDAASPDLLNGRSSGDSARGWLFLDASGAGAAGANGHGHGQGPAATAVLEREWRLQAKVVQQWRCHPERMRAIAAFDHESSVVTAGRGLVSGKQAEVLRCWRISTGTAGVQYSQHRAKVTSIVALPGPSALVASRDEGGEIHLWSSETGNQAALLAKSMPSPMTRSPQGFSCIALAVHGHDDSILAGTDDGHLQVLDVAQQQWVLRLQCRPPHLSQSLTAIAAWSVSAAGASQCYAAGVARGEAAVVDTRAGHLVRHWAAHSDSIVDLACSGEQLITASKDCLLKVWDLRATGSSSAPTPLAVIGGHKHPISRIALYGNNVLSLGGSRLGVTSLQQPHTDQLQAVKLADGVVGAALTSLALLPCCRLLLTGTADGVMQVCC